MFRINFRFYSVRIGITFQTSLFLLLWLLSYTVCSGQNRGARGLVSFGPSSGLADDTLYLDINQDIAVQLLPFDDIMKVAVAHSPLIKYQNEVGNSLNSAYQVAKVQILQNVSGFANYSTGNQSIISSGTTTITGRDALGQIANGYRVGVDVRVPLYELFGRKHQVRQAYSNYRASVIQKETIELELKRDMIGVYQDMITTQQLLKYRLIDEQASLTALRVAEVEIQKGRITADALANITSRYVQAKTSSEQIKGDFLKNVHYFEALVGMPIQRLKRN
ncbi:TolC family protein [Spirosoma flavum]|uniref:TolC family protein n=1 Tax=Spirosoma flavum TaxID=2048557 RepID=A0ABW6AET0_9BACT